MRNCTKYNINWYIYIYIHILNNYLHYYNMLSIEEVIIQLNYYLINFN
jgi:hypothetical protein